MTTYDQVPGSRARWPIASSIIFVAAGAAANYWGIEQLPSLVVVLLTFSGVNLCLYLLAKLRLVVDNALLRSLHGIVTMMAFLGAIGVGSWLVGYFVLGASGAIDGLMSAKTVLAAVTNGLAFVFPLLLLIFPILAAYLLIVYVRADIFGPPRSE